MTKFFTSLPMDRYSLTPVERYEGLIRRQQNCAIDDALRRERQRETWRMFVRVETKRAVGE